MATPVSPDDHENARPKKRVRSSVATFNGAELVLSLRRLDPVLMFLCRATGKATIPVSTLKAALPGDDAQKQQVLQHVPELVKRGVLHTVNNDIGFPPPPSLSDTVEKAQVKKTIGTLHGCTKAAAKRRLAALNRSLKEDPILNVNDCSMEQNEQDESNNSSSKETQQKGRQDAPTPQKEWSSCPLDNDSDDALEEEEILEEETQARHTLEMLFKFSPSGMETEEKSANGDSIAYILPKQAAYAGSNAGRSSCYGSLSPDVKARILSALFDSFGFERDGTIGRRRLYEHQAAAIDSAMRNVHTLVCTGTGSGKSLCFLIPVLAAAMQDQHCSSLLMFPTKALAQDQLTKLEELIRENPALQQLVRPGVIDGDTPHQNRGAIAKSCNIILTNPDTLHAAILPGWKKVYRPVLERVKYIVIDETHMYEGVFGAHVAMVLSRLMRLCAVCSVTRTDQLSWTEPRMMLPTFLACSATMSHPEHHFRMLCPIPRDSPITVLKADDDGSPRSSKHFFVWNPPIMNINGMSTGHVTISKSRQHVSSNAARDKVGNELSCTRAASEDSGDAVGELCEGSPESLSCGAPSATGGKQLFRRHAADETALLLAKAVKNKVRCIAFCKTRSLVEWVYEKTISALRSDLETEHLASQVESYRGGYSVDERRLIEQRLFKNELLAVVGTSALELGVDIGGIDITLHCGYPSSRSSLLQQAGRAGRGSTRLSVPSLAIMICFNSPSEQHIWRHPKNLLSHILSIPASVPVNVGLVEGHMLCAGEEYPLVGRSRVTCLASCSDEVTGGNSLLNDHELLGGEEHYREARSLLVSNGSLLEETVPVFRNETIKVNKTHLVSLALFSNYTIRFRLIYPCTPFEYCKSLGKPWTRVSLRSIEPITYSIVDASHPLQGGRMDTIMNEKAVLDTIPYSRVFYHAFPGAIITHRGRRYKVLSMTRPPSSASSFTRYRGSCNLAAFAKPTSARYSTRPLSTMTITVVKQMERIDFSADSKQSAGILGGNEGSAVQKDSFEIENSSLAGSGVVTVKRSVHGYKKLSPVTRTEFSRAEISLPPMEFDTYGLWIETEAASLAPVVKDYDEGVHALSHALLAVAPLFVPCASSDLDCDHKSFRCSRIMLFDLRAGGAGTAAHLWKFLFMPDGLLHAALDLLQNCPSCSLHSDYQGGCPACIQSGHCLKFNQYLSRTAGAFIARRMLGRIKETALYRKNCEIHGRKEYSVDDSVLLAESEIERTNSRAMEIPSPRRKARATALRDAKKLKSARERQIVVGRPSWPLDEVGEHEVE